MSAMEGPNSQVVRQSRAGDAFHYRWAARRCLRLVELNSPLRCVTIEGSKESKQAGEFAIDVAEYYERPGGGENVAYIQLKHSTVRTTKPFSLSEFAPTLKQFAKRYSAASLKTAGPCPVGSVSFSLVTNRPISETVARAVQALADGVTTTERRKFEAATKLKGDDLRAFCGTLSLVGGVGDYRTQKHELRGEMADYLVGAVERSEVDGLIALVIDRALPKSEDDTTTGEIHREHVLQKLEVTSMRQLFPAKREMEVLVQSIKREQHAELLRDILTHAASIIHAPGGVGKSVVARQLSDSLPIGTWGLVYDCFGAGNYRNPSEPRHRARDALVQMANEMAVAGLCRPLIARRDDSSADLFQGFLERLTQAMTSLRIADAQARMVLFVDAADNAEMAAADVNQECFVRPLLRTPLPDGCRLVMLCRTERIQLLQPQSTVKQLALRPFSLPETAAHLRRTFSSATDDHAQELHRLTSGNPRVQANALNVAGRTVVDVLNSFGPAGTTVEAQIAQQLQAAVAKLKDEYPASVAQQVDAICLGLANLPPFIPLAILAQAAGVDTAAIASFVSDLGRPLWLRDDSVQFRDEPTETWFREKFGGDKRQIRTYIAALEPLAATSTYAARALPELLHRAGDHPELVALALSDYCLPENNPVDARNIRVYRLQFAFRSSLALKRLTDACKLALRAGEEVAGDTRQMELLGANVDLIYVLQSAHRVQELAYNRSLSSSWEGSENVYTASLLSYVPAFKGEAIGYLRGAEKWLRIFFEERKKRAPDDHFGRPQLRVEDVVELGAAAHNLHGAAASVRFFTTWKPAEYNFRITRLFVERLIDASQFDAIDELARRGAKHPYFMLAAADALMAVGRCPPKDTLRLVLKRLGSPVFKIERVDRYSHQDSITPAVLSVCEAATLRGLPIAGIQAVLERCTTPLATSAVGDRFSDDGRRIFMRGAALRAVLAGLPQPTTESLLPKRDATKPETRHEREDDGEIAYAISGLMPSYYARACVLARNRRIPAVEPKPPEARRTSTSYNGYRINDRIPKEAMAVRFEVLALKTDATAQELDEFAKEALTRPEEDFYLIHRVPATRTAFRQPHLAPLRDRLERSCCKAIKGMTDTGPSERAAWFIQLARAVMAQSKPDASAYFASAVEAVSKFGDEVVDRWRAVSTIASRGAVAQAVEAKLGYRFGRCAEMVGVSVDDDKYWNRDQVFEVLVNLHPPSAFAVLSRWRDRDVGSFRSQLHALILEAVDKKHVSPAAGWSMSGFVGCNASMKLAVKCLSLEPEAKRREVMTETTLRDLELAGASAHDFEELEQGAAEFPDLRDRLVQILAVVRAADTARPDRSRHSAPSPRVGRVAAIDALLEDVDILDSVQLERAVVQVHTMEPPREFEVFWREVISRIPPGREVELLGILPSLRSTSIFDASSFLSEIRKEWQQKVAVEREWLPFLTRVGKSFAVALSNSERLAYWAQSSALSQTELDAVRAGFMDGLAEAPEFVGASTFFGFVYSVAPGLNPPEALDLLAFALDRFELHYPPDFGDGDWSEALRPPDNPSRCLAGLVWSALGSPFSDARWEAAHVVRRLAAVACDQEISALIDLMRQDGVGAFGCHRYPFYSLHARQYMLIAFVRVALENPAVLRVHHRVLAMTALEGLPQVLIQRFAAETALRIDHAIPGTYDAPTLEKLRNVGVSPYPRRRVKRFGKLVDTPWHAAGTVDLKGEMSFDNDFDHYWFDQFQSIFGVSQEQAEQLGQEIAVQQLHIPSNEGRRYVADPRSHQLESDDYYERGTTHSHGSYPRTHTHRFYYSYHAFLCTAARLLAHMPVVDDGDRGDPWKYFLSRHGLTRRDGCWLADRRDPASLRRRAWLNETEREHWRWRIHRDDFADVLVNSSAGLGFVCVDGHWVDCAYDRMEHLRVRSALVNCEAAEALAQSTRLARDAHDFAFPTTDDDEDEYTAPPFELLGWINRRSGGDPRLDQFDPHAKQISYPPNEVGAKYAALLGLTPDYERRGWFGPNARTPSVVTEIWSEQGFSRRDAPARSGHRMSAKVETLKQLCVATGKDLIVCVEINRRSHRDYRSSETDEDRYLPDSHQVFLFSADGFLRDARKSLQLG